MNNDFRCRLLGDLFGSIFDHRLDRFFHDLLNGFFYSVFDGLHGRLFNNVFLRLIRQDNGPVRAHESRCPLVVDLHLVPAVNRGDML